MFGELKARPASATPDLSYIISNPLLDRALRRTAVACDLRNEPSKQPANSSRFADPAGAAGSSAALQGAAEKWNSNILKRHIKRSKNAHKLPNKRSRRAVLELMLQGVSAALRILADCDPPNPFWQDLHERVTRGEQEALFEHATAYMHSKCRFNTCFSTFTVSSHVATASLKRRGRSFPSSFCMARVEKLVPVSATDNEVPVEADKGLVPVYVLYFCRLNWHSGEKEGEGECREASFAHVLLLPTKTEPLHSHTVYSYQSNSVTTVNMALHRIVLIRDIKRPLIVDRSLEGCVTLVPFEGKGLVDMPPTQAEAAEEEEEIDWGTDDYSVDLM
jgi:hypothetical protein